MKTDLRTDLQLSGRLLLQISVWGGIGTIVLIVCMSVWFDVQARQIWLDGRRFTAQLMAQGLSTATHNNLASRNYAELEIHLKQAVSDSRVKSALVADVHGKVLSHVVRNEATQDIAVQYLSPSVTLPQEAQWLQESGTTFVQWMRIENGVQLGWLRLELLATQADQALVALRQRFILVFGLASLFLLGLLLVVTRRAQQMIRSREASILEKQEQLEEVAYHDSLTHLANRHQLLERLTQEMAACNRHDERLLVCFLDLDGFKEVNDTHGHDAGDDVLRAVAQRLKENVRENDTVARLGGDEFVLVLTRMNDPAHCEQALQRILQVVGEPIVIGGSLTVQVSASMGVTIFPADDSAPGILLEHADRAMYSAKYSGKNKWLLYEVERKQAA